MSESRILVVDDRPENLRAIEAVLEPLECEVVTVSSGADALRILLRQTFAVILLDVQMPEMDGFETASLIRDRKRTRQIPIIFVSAVSTSTDHVFRGYEAGAVDYIVKPLDPVAIRSKVRVFVELHERGEEIRRQSEILRERELENARREAERRRHRRAALLDSLSVALERRTDIAGCADQLVRSCVQEFAELAIAEVLPDGNRPVLALACSDQAHVDELREYLLRYGTELEGIDPCDRGYTDRQLSRDDWLAVVPGPLGERAWDRVAPGSVVVVPLRFEGRRLGRLTLARSRPGGPFGVEELELAGELAKRAAMAIENSRLYELEHERSRMLQLSLVGGVPLGHPVVSAATRYVAGTADLEVGGDWFDLIERDDGRIAVIVGDVVGRGLRAATAMGKLRSAVGALAHVSESPAEILQRLDRFAAGIAEAELATVVCALLDPEDGTLRYSSAGHPPGLVVGADGEAVFLEDGRGFPLGVDFAAPRAEGVAVLAVGSTLILFTDGLVEAPGMPIEVGLERLAAAASERPDQHPERLCDELLETMVDRLRDDIALVALRVSPVPAEFQVWNYPAEADRLAPARHAFARWLTERGVPDEVRADLVLAFGEACSNCVRHAYMDGDGAISVHLRHHDGMLTVRVSDTGRWTASNPLAGGGRGLDMIRMLSDDSHVHGTPYGTTVVMSKRIEMALPGDVAASANGHRFSSVSAG